MKFRALMTLFFACLSLSPYAQIGTKIPDSRLPLVTASPRHTQWQEAGYLKFVPQPIYYSLLLNVKDLGAVGDNVADDTAAFQSAISQAAAESALGGFTIVYAPAGTYKITASLSLANDMVLKGAGSTQTTLNILNPTGNCINVSSKHNFAVEDLKLITGTQNSTAIFIFINNSHDGWVRGVETSYAPKNHIRIQQSHNIEVRECYIHHGLNYGGGGNGYGVEFNVESYHCLIENNVFNNLRHAMIHQCDVKWNVFGYNASYNPVRDETPSDWAADMMCHGSWDSNRNPPYENLFEGNIGNHIQCDGYHGPNGPYNTFFRNRAARIGITIDSQTNNQNIANNYVKNLSYTYTLIGYPWSVAGSGHLAGNNRCDQKKLFSGWNTFWRASQDSTYNNDYSYYLTAKPAFMGSLAWPFNAISANNAAANRGYATLAAGWGDYSNQP